MILTKAKESQLTSLNSGITTETMQLSVNQSNNFWVDWADAFVKLCINKLGLEVEEGPGTSIGKFQAGYGPTRYQYDCDWNVDKGRIPGYEVEEVGFTLWEDVPIWENSLKEYGIDRINKRFDIIIWFTTESTDPRPERTGERLGIRIKYPITTERGYNCGWYISRAPAIMPWFKNNTEFNNERLVYKAGYINGRIGVDDIYNNNETYVYRTTEDAYKYDRVRYLHNADKHNGCLTSAFTTQQNFPWPHYVDEIKNEGEALYSSLGGNYSSAVPSGYRSYNIFQYIVSSTKNTIDLKVKDNNGDIIFDILYGNLMEEQVGNSAVTNSFVSIVVGNSTGYFSDWFITDNGYRYRSPKSINRPNSIDNTQRMYWGISRLLLDKEYVHCKDLYQVFSFGDLMNNTEYALKIFVDKNNDEHTFVLFNYGQNNSSANRVNDILLALPL